MSKKTFLEYAETPNGSMLLSSVSVANNILSAINTTNATSSVTLEAKRSIALMFFDIVGIAGTFLGNTKYGKALNVGSWVAETGLVVHRLFAVNLPSYDEYRDFHSDKYKQFKGNIPLTVIYDIIADTASVGWATRCPRGSIVYT